MKRRKPLSQIEAKRAADKDAAARARRAAKLARADTLTVEAAAQRLGIGRNQAYQHVKGGKIPCVKLGRRYLIARATIDRILSGEITVAA